LELVSVQNCPENKTKQTNPEQIHMFTYSTYLHIGNNPDNYLFKIFSLVIYFYFITFLEKVVYSHFSNNISEMNTCCPMKKCQSLRNDKKRYTSLLIFFSPNQRSTENTSLIH